MKQFVFIICCILYCVFGMDLPLYIPRCSLLDSKFSKCSVQNANKAIPRIVRGDPKLKIPLMSPFRFSEINFESKNIKICTTNTTFHGLADTLVANYKFDLVNGKIDIDTKLDILAVTGGYSINKGRISSRPVFGKGTFIWTFVGNEMNCKASFSIYSDHDGPHMQFINATATFKTNRTYFYFEDLHSTETGNINGFIDKNWRTLQNEIKPILEDYVGLFFRIPAEAITYNVPMNNIFYP